uniref:RING-type domain-containing protein n=1 Tax=Ananas comosus var. bracteatus TaxID=296719 RepID=A0A6V7PA01_ANACO|nr:unnamed protein product [Ananas comosus var. bracteatus]
MEVGLSFSSHLARLLLDADDATDSAAPLPSARPSSSSPFRPSVAVIVGVLTTMFSLTFLLLLYAKHCKRGVGDGALGVGGGPGYGGYPSSGAAERRHSGVDRAVVESLPVFRRFEPAEVLRLLPKCRHCFHVECVDTWLDAHSTCPLCRVRVDPEDVVLLPAPPPEPDPYPGPDKPAEAKCEEVRSGRRVSGRHSTGSLQIVVQRAEPAVPRTRRSADATGCLELNRVRKDRLLLAAAEDPEGFERRFSHRVVVSGDAAAERWSDLRPSDLLFLRSEMIITDSGRFSASRAAGASGGDVVSGARCLSELAGVSRIAPSRAGGWASRTEEEERSVMRRWLGFAAKRTARWLRGPPGDNGPS